MKPPHDPALVPLLPTSNLALARLWLVHAPLHPKWHIQERHQSHHRAQDGGSPTTSPEAHAGSGLRFGAGSRPRREQAGPGRGRRSSLTTTSPPSCSRGERPCRRQPGDTFSSTPCFTGEKIRGHCNSPSSASNFSQRRAPLILPKQRGGSNQFHRDPSCGQKREVNFLFLFFLRKKTNN